MVKKSNNINITTFEEHLDKEYGPLGSESRTNFEIKAKAFAIGKIIREARKEAHMTQEDLARKTGTKKSYISRLENGKIDSFRRSLFPGDIVTAFYTVFWRYHNLPAYFFEVSHSIIM